MKSDLEDFNFDADGSMNKDPLGERDDMNYREGLDDMGRWIGKSDVQPDICKHGKHATSLKNLELQFTGAFAITPCPVCLAEMRKETE